MLDILEVPVAPTELEVNSVAGLLSWELVNVPIDEELVKEAPGSSLGDSLTETSADVALISVSDATSAEKVLEPAADVVSGPVLGEEDEILEAGNEVTPFSVGALLKTGSKLEVMTGAGASEMFSVSVLLGEGVKIELLWVKLASDRISSVELPLEDGNSVATLPSELESVLAVGREVLPATLSLDVRVATAVPSDREGDVKGTDDVAPLLLVTVPKLVTFVDSVAELAGVASSASKL